MTAIYHIPAPFKWIPWFEEMKEVKKLVLTSDTCTWLSYISELHLFPSLTELQLHDQETHNIPAILEFLKKRTASNPIQILRLVQLGTDVAAIYDVSRLKEDASVFTQLVPCVVFEDKFTPSLRMELPIVCTTSSAAHGYWQSWEKHLYKEYF
ncbi:hypothetical protein BC835DRAFT_1379238 [Cytidiella melzeri]|nr:hypothetical protein BC835DRAFT_1379238 [Cytidiella melzeri]